MIIQNHQYERLSYKLSSKLICDNPFYTPRQLTAIIILGVALALFYVFRYYAAVTGKYVRSSYPKVWAEIEGDVAHPGIYGLCAEDASLGKLIREAGGLSSSVNVSNPGLLDRKVAYGDSWLVTVTAEGRFVVKKSVIRGSRALALGLKMPLNSATEEDLLALPLMNRKIATKIIEYRKLNGPITSFIQLGKIPGVTERRMKRWKPYISLDLKR